MSEVKSSGGDAPTDAEAKALELKAQGNEHYKKKDTAKALELYKQAAALAPHMSTLYGNMCAVHMQRGEFELCIAAGEQAMALEGEPAWRSKIFERMGRAWSALHRQQNALQSYLHAMQAAPDNHELRKRVMGMMTLVQRMEHKMQQADAKLALGKFGEGKLVGGEAIRLARELDDWEFVARALHIRGQCLLELEDRDGAQDDFATQLDLAVKAGSTVVEALACANVARLASVRGELARAVEFNERAVDAFTRAADGAGDTQTHSMLGRAHINLGVSQHAAGDDVAAAVSARKGRAVAERLGDAEGMKMADEALALAGATGVDSGGE